MNKEKTKINPKGREIRMVLIYTGAFLFSIVMIIAIHELGHYLAFILRGYDSVHVMINPFMGATMSSTEIKPEDGVLIILAGTTVNLFVASGLALILWNRRKPFWIPFKMIPATAFLIEGMVIIAGYFIQERVTDFSFLILLGWSPVIVGLLGILFVLIGGYLNYEVWLDIGIRLDCPRTKLFLFNGVFILYILSGFLLSQHLLPTEMETISRFLRINFAFHGLYLAIRILIAPVVLPLIRRGKEWQSMQYSIQDSSSSMVLGIVAWMVSFIVLN